MKIFYSLVIAAFMLIQLPAYAEDAAVSAETEVQAEGNFFTRSWANIKGFFSGSEAGSESKAQAEGKTTAEAQADGSVIDKAADSTKSGVDWTAEKAKQGAEWTKETAKDVTQATGKGIKKVGAAIEGLFPNANDTQVDVEAQVDADTEVDTE